MCVRVVVASADMWFSNFAIEYLCENETVRETVYACSYGAQVESVQQTKIWSKISWYCPFNEFYE